MRRQRNNLDSPVDELRPRTNHECIGLRSNEISKGEIDLSIVLALNISIFSPAAEAAAFSSEALN